MYKHYGGKRKIWKTWNCLILLLFNASGDPETWNVPPKYLTMWEYLCCMLKSKSLSTLRLFVIVQKSDKLYISWHFVVFLYGASWAIFFFFFNFTFWHTKKIIISEKVNMRKRKDKQRSKINFYLNGFSLCCLLKYVFPLLFSLQSFQVPGHSSLPCPFLHSSWHPVFLWLLLLHTDTYWVLMRGYIDRYNLLSLAVLFACICYQGWPLWFE